VVAGLQLGHLDDEDRLGLIDPAELDREPLHGPRLEVADVEIGVRCAAHDVGEAGEIVSLVARQRLQAGDDPARRHRLVGGGSGRGVGAVGSG
jgi:hypothetical protein